MFLYDIFKVIYSPIKAFREVMQKPRYVGPALIIIISLCLTVGTQYVSISKQYVETINPSSPRDAWTNMTSPSSLWVTNIGNATSVSNENSDFLAGNYSVRSAVVNSSEILLETTSIGTVNCSDPDGYRTLYYKLMYNASSLTQTNLTASAAELRLFSLNNESDYYEFNLLSNGTRYLNSSQTWINANVTLNFASGPGWTTHGTPNQENITGVEFLLQFPENGSSSMYLNDLYFGGKYEILYGVVGFSYWAASTAISSISDILLRWLIFAGLLWVTIKVFHSQGTLSLKTLLVIVGYAFAIMFVYVTVDILSISQLPILYFPNKVIYPLTGQEISAASQLTSNIYNAYWTPTAAYGVFIGAWYLSHVWTIALFTIALKTTITDISWKKAALISAIAYVIGLFLRAIIPI